MKKFLLSILMVFVSFTTSFGEMQDVLLERAEVLQRGNVIGAFKHALLPAGTYYIKVGLRDHLGYVIASDPDTGEAIDLLVFSNKYLYNSLKPIAEQLGVADRLFVFYKEWAVVKITVSSPVILSHFFNIFIEESPLSDMILTRPFNWTVEDRRLGFVGVPQQDLVVVRERGYIARYIQFYGSGTFSNVKVMFAVTDPTPEGYYIFVYRENGQFVSKRRLYDPLVQHYPADVLGFIITDEYVFAKSCGFGGENGKFYHDCWAYTFESIKPLTITVTEPTLLDIVFTDDEKENIHLTLPFTEDEKPKWDWDYIETHPYID